MKLSDLMRGIDYIENDMGNIQIEAISHPFGKVKKCCAYFLIKRLDEEKVEANFEAVMPSVIICEADDAPTGSAIPVVIVKSARSALSIAYSNFYGIDYDRLKIIGITGTNGKTTTATIIKEVLRSAGKRVGFIGTGMIAISDEIISENNYSMTTPDPETLYTLLRAMSDLGCDYVVMEVSSHSLALGKVAPIKFHRAVFTNLSPEHLDFHKSMDDYFSAKSILFKQCRTGIFNIDDKRGKDLYESSICPKISCGIIENADFSAFNIEMSGLDGSNYIFRGEAFTSRVTLKLPGAFNIYNSLLAFACCVSIDIKPCVIKKAISAIPEITGRLNIIKDRVTVIIDYAHTAFAMEECLRFLSHSKPPRKRLISVFGCGGERDRLKRPKMAGAAQKYSDEIIITSDNTRGENLQSIINDIISGFDENASYQIIEDRERAIVSAIKLADDGDFVVILGKGHERYNITQSGYEPFDEKEIVYNALRRE